MPVSSVVGRSELRKVAEMPMPAGLPAGTNTLGGSGGI